MRVRSICTYIFHVSLQSLQKAVAVAQQHLEMPPMPSEREPIDETLTVDEILDGTETAKFVFTDITYSTPHRVSIL